MEKAYSPLLKIFLFFMVHREKSSEHYKKIWDLFFKKDNDTFSHSPLNSVELISGIKFGKEIKSSEYYTSF